MAQSGELRKVAEGREAEMFAWGDGAILRLLRDSDAQLRNEWQAAAMEAARASGVRVPAVLEVTAVLGRPGLVMERIEGVDLLTLIGRRPWTVFRAARICGEVQAQLHAVEAPKSLPDLRATLKQRIESAGRLPERLAQFSLSVLEGLPDGDSLCQGDFHPGNIMSSPEGPVLIDWTNATRGDPNADVARSVLMLRMGEPPPGTAAIIRVLRRVGGKLLLDGYVRAYRQLRPVDMGLVGRWQVPVAAARLSEGIASEVPALLRLLERARGALG